MFNAFYTDQNTDYPSAEWDMPAGSELLLKAEFPHARSLSYTVYHPGPGATGVGSSQQLTDAEIQPDPGSTNPFLPGANRAARNRSYTIRFVEQPLPPVDERAPNTMYVTPFAGGIGNLLVVRNYLRDKRDVPELPAQTLRLADGTELTGQAACDAMNTSSKDNIPFPNRAFDPAEYRQFRDNPDGALPNTNPVNTWPARNPVVWNRLWTTPYNFCLEFQLEAGEDPEQECGPNPGSDPNGPGFANPSNGYLQTWIDRQFGEVFVMRARKPVTPTTYFGDRRVPDGGTELRYFSVTAQESLYTWRAADSVMDEEIPTDEDGFYTIVVSRPDFRPRNATFECGVAWLEFSPAGDGFGDLKLTQLFMRNQDPSPGFTHAIQSIPDTGFEEATMGEFFPQSQYTSPQDFDAQFPCNRGGGHGHGPG